MKTFVILAFAIIMFPALTASQELTQPSTASQGQLVGAWKLVSLEESSEDGHLHKADCDGMFIFTSEGTASVQLMYRNANSGSSYAQGGYEASYGRYVVDSSSTFTFHIDGALVRTLVGKDLKRGYEISGNRLVVKSTDPNERWKVVWERYQGVAQR